MIAAPLARLSRRLVSWIDPEPIDLTQDIPLAPEQYDPRRETDSLSQWLPWLAYDDDTQLFLLEDEQPGQVGAYGFAIELLPQTGATEQMWSMFQTLFTNAPRECTSVQLQLYASPSLDGFLQAFERLMPAGDWCVFVTNSGAEANGNCSPSKAWPRST